MEIEAPYERSPEVERCWRVVAAEPPGGGATVVWVQIEHLRSAPNPDYGKGPRCHHGLKIFDGQCTVTWMEVTWLRSWRWNAGATKWSNSETRKYLWG